MKARKTESTMGGVREEGFGKSGRKLENNSRR